MLVKGIAVIRVWIYFKFDYKQRYIFNRHSSIVWIVYGKLLIKTVASCTCLIIICQLIWFAGPRGKYVSRLNLIITTCLSFCLHYYIHYVNCPACRTSLIATTFWVVVICPIIKYLTVLEFSFILFDLCLFITIFNFILNYVPIVTFWIFTYHKIWISLIIFCFIWNYCIIYFLTCLEVFWGVVS